LKLNSAVLLVFIWLQNAVGATCCKVKCFPMQMLVKSLQQEQSNLLCLSNELLMHSGSKIRNQISVLFEQASQT